MRNKTLVTGRFKAKDATGRTYDVVETTDMIHAGTLQSPNEWIPGLKAYRLANGQPLNPTDEDNVFEIVGHEIRVRRV